MMTPFNNHDGRETRGPQSLSPEEIWQLIHNPDLRWADVPGGDILATHLMLNTDDPDLRELFDLVVQQQIGAAMTAGDAFHGNYPPMGQLPRPAPGCIPLCTMPTGDVLSIGIGDLTRNLLVVGSTGSGKTNFLRALMLAVLEAES